MSGVFDIEDVMQMIRNDKCDSEAENGFTFELDDFEDMIKKMRRKEKVSWYRNISGNKIVVCIKKIVRCMIRPFLGPVVEDQNYYNTINVDMYVYLEKYIKDSQLEIKRLNNRIEELEYKINEKNNARK